MKALFVTTYPIFLPTFNNEKYINISPEGKPAIFMAKIGDDYLFIAECLDKEQSHSKGKRNLFIAKLDILLTYINSISGLRQEDVFYLVHDYDVVDKHHVGTYSINEFQDKDPLRQRFMEGHLYLFMHEDGVEEYDSFIGYLPEEITEEHMKVAFGFFASKHEA